MWNHHVPIWYLRNLLTQGQESKQRIGAIALKVVDLRTTEIAQSAAGPIPSTTYSLQNNARRTPWYGLNEEERKKEEGYGEKEKEEDEKEEERSSFVP